jgi:hypothetical protein
VIPVQREASENNERRMRGPSGVYSIIKKTSDAIDGCGVFYPS